MTWFRDARPIHYRWIFGKVPKGGGGVISDPKNFVAIFFALETALLVMNFRKNFEIGGGSFPIQKISLQIQCWSSWILEKIATFFPKKGGGGWGVKGRLELFQKFIDNGSDGRPSVSITKISGGFTFSSGVWLPKTKHLLQKKRRQK